MRVRVYVSRIVYVNVCSTAVRMSMAFTCMDDIPGSSLDSDANGDFLVLAYLQNLPKDSHPTFYCAVSIHWYIS